MSGKPLTAGDVGAAGAMTAVLRDALKPNLVQTAEGGPALVHAGPFANIAHGCSSVLATRLGMASADYTITEAGFGFDLGGEKFLDIKCRQMDVWPRTLVLVATLRALKMHGGAPVKSAGEPDPSPWRRGCPTWRSTWRRRPSTACRWWWPSTSSPTTRRPRWPWSTRP